jgi:phosphatidylglycerophosphate synthase
LTLTPGAAVALRRSSPLPLDGARLARAALILAVLGATLGPVLDYLHVVTGAIRYLPPVRFVPWWVPLLYTGAALVIGLSHPLADALILPRARPPLTPARLAAGFAAFCAVWFASGALPLSSAIVAAILAPVSLALWGWLDGTWQGLVQAAATAAGGCAVEMVLSGAGLFSHTHPDVLGVALWLPWIYVAASVGVGNVGRWLAVEPARS